MSGEYPINLRNGTLLTTLYPLESNGPNNTSSARQVLDARFSFPVVGIGGNNTFYISGDHTNRIFTGDKFYVTGTGNPSVSGDPTRNPYTATSVSYNSGTNRTYIVVSTPLNPIIGGDVIHVNSFLFGGDLTHRFMNGVTSFAISGASVGNGTYTIIAVHVEHQPAPNDTEVKHTIVQVSQQIPDMHPSFGFMTYQIPASASVTLLGRGVTNYGERLQENVVHMLENFANDTEPTHSLKGQLWYRTLSGSEGFLTYTGSAYTSNWDMDTGSTLYKDLGVPTQDFTVKGSALGLTVSRTADPAAGSNLFRVASAAGTEIFGVQYSGFVKSSAPLQVTPAGSVIGGTTAPLASKELSVQNGLVVFSPSATAKLEFVTSGVARADISVDDTSVDKQLRINSTSTSNVAIAAGGGKVLVGSLSSATSEKLQVTGQVKVTTTAQPPFVVNDSTLVTNLNADKLDGQDGTYYNDIANLVGVLPITKGGTGLSATPMAGELMIGTGSTPSNGTYTRATLTGTANRVTVTNGPGSITLSGPQDIASTSSPTFANLTISASGKITLPNDPVIDDFQAVHKRYVDSVATGLDIKQSVKAATTANITLSGLQTIDGISLSADDRVLVKNQTDQTQNGIYDVKSGAWVRSYDADNSPVGGEVTSGLYAYVEQGNTQGTSGWVLSTSNPITLGTTALTFTQFTGPNMALAAPAGGLEKIGQEFSIKALGFPLVAGGPYNEFYVNSKGQITQAQANDLGSTYQAIDDNLTGISNVTNTGIYVKTGVDTADTRSIAVSGGGLSITNANGVAGNPTITIASAVTNDPNTLVMRDGSGNITATVTGTSSSANSLTTGHTIGMTGDVTWTSGSFNGTADVTGTATLANSGVSASTYGSATNIPQLTIDAKGRVTSATTVGVTPPWSSITSKPTTVSGFGITDAYTKTETNDLITGLTFKEAVKAATTANITLSGSQTIDGVTLVAGDRVLVKNQTNAVENGVYVASSSAWVRALDVDQSAEVKYGMYVLVVQGTAAGGTGWILTTPNPITVGTTALTFSQYNSAAGANLQTVCTAGNSTSTTMTISGGTLNLSNATSNMIIWNNIGVAPPDINSRSVGTKLILWSGAFPGSTDYALGIDGSTLWNSVPNTASMFKWYSGSTLAATLTHTLSSTGGNGYMSAGQFVSTTADGVRLKTNAGTTSRGVILRNDGATLYFLITNNNDANGTWNTLRPLYIDLAGGNVTMAHGLTVSGNLYAGYIQSTAGWIDSSFGVQALNGNVQAVSGDLLSYRSGAASQGLVWLGNTGHYLHFNGSVYFFAGSNTVQATDFAATSDIRLKTNIEKIENPLEKLTAMRGVTYLKQEVPGIGVIAQEVQEVFPELVEENGETDILSVKYNGLIALLIEAVKEQQKQIDELKARLS